MYVSIVIAACLLLLFSLLFKEVKRQNKSWLATRVIASIVAVASLACMAFPVLIHYHQNVNNAGAAILLTDGFNSDSVQKVVSDNINAKVFTTDKNISVFNATYITGTELFNDDMYAGKALHVFGYGVNKNELSGLKNTPVIFHPALVENKFTSIAWTQKLSAGDALVIQGGFNNTTSSPDKIILSGFDTNLDSITIPAKKQTYFQLAAAPKHLDKAVYSLIVLSGKDTLEKEPIPVEINTTQPLSILVLSASPDFENKFLRNWLAQSEYKFIIKTSISKNKYDRQFANIPAVSFERITSSLLEKFDVIIADASELSALPSSEISTIKNSIESKGLGLIVKADSAKNTSAFYLNSFSLTAITDSIQHSIKLNLNDTSRTMPALKMEQPVFIRNVTGTQPLIKDQQMHVMASSKMYGAGKVVITTIGNSYTWQLSGNSNDYNAYWSWLLQKAAKKNLLQNEWHTINALPQKNEEVDLKLQTVSANIPQPQAAGNMLYPQQNFLLPYEWNATYWPSNTGWQPLMNDTAATWLYVYSAADWQPIKALEKIAATKKYAAEHTYQPLKDEEKNITVTVELSKFYFFILFIISAGFLWFEKKYNDV